MTSVLVVVTAVFYCNFTVIITGSVVVVAVIAVKTPVGCLQHYNNSYD